MYCQLELVCLSIIFLLFFLSDDVPTAVCSFSDAERAPVSLSQGTRKHDSTLGRSLYITATQFRTRAHKKITNKNKNKKHSLTYAHTDNTVAKLSTDRTNIHFRSINTFSKSSNLVIFVFNDMLLKKVTRTISP